MKSDSQNPSRFKTLSELFYMLDMCEQLGWKKAASSFAAIASLVIVVSVDHLSKLAQVDPDASPEDKTPERVFRDEMLDWMDKNPPNGNNSEMHAMCIQKLEAAVRSSMQ